MSLGSLDPLPSDPLADVSRATQQLDAAPFMRGEEAHHREIHECGLRQVEHEPRTVPLHLRLQLAQVILLDAATEPERGRLSVRGDVDFESHARGESKRRATTKRVRDRELVLRSVTAGWQLPTGERD